MSQTGPGPASSAGLTAPPVTGASGGPITPGSEYAAGLCRAGELRILSAVADSYTTGKQKNWLVVGEEHTLL